MSKIKILLLTNRDSDNVGDQIIEATVISLLKGVMRNLGFSTRDYMISSRAAGIITKKYLHTRDPALLEDARRAISGADVVVFGGAPLFNYTYQNFYRRTIKTLELAQEYGVPVLFSSIGVEAFDATNPKCLQLKEALALPCVKQITTRDRIESLQAYVEGTDIPIAHVSDPAVFADVVFRTRPWTLTTGQHTVVGRRARQFVTGLRRKHEPSLPVSARALVSAKPRMKIGLVATRAGIFRDNGIVFSENDQRKLWLDVIELLSARGYDYTLFTTGHFSDEVFLDSMVKAERIPAGNAAVMVNSPEELIDELRACNGVIAYRLHASITSFAYGIPSVGLSWNFKVPYFYDSVGHGERALSSEHWVASEVVSTLETAMSEGVAKDEAFLMSVYDTLFSGLKGILAAESTRTPYSLAEVRQKLPAYRGTSSARYREKVRSKLRRTYENYQKLSKYYLEAEAKKKSDVGKSADA